MAPGVLAGVLFGFADIFAKLTFASGADVLTASTLRGCLGVLCVAAWLRGSPPRPCTKRERRISLWLGVLFAANIALLLEAIALVPVPVAILTYFAYPLLTGIAGTFTGIERLGVFGAAVAVAAFGGLALMIGAHDGQLAWLGIVLAFLSACGRVLMFLIQRASLGGADARLISWYSLLGSTVVLSVLSVATGSWGLPGTGVGWVALLGFCACSTVSVVAMFISTARVGAFRTALVMNLEPVVGTVLSVAVLGDTVTPVQLLGAAIMIAALCAFQLRW
ncbi:MAG TPA: DMT family transporter [Acetobacteraceae bacterium]|nr:DMT family transporter [Acetobacteraceae bacterium]